MQEMQEVLVQSLDLESPLEKYVATHSSILPWRIPWIENLRVSSPWVAQLDTTEATEHAHTHPSGC